MSKPTPKLLRSTHHAALTLSHVVHTSSIGSSSAIGTSSSTFGGQGGVASARSLGVVARRLHDSTNGTRSTVGRGVGSSTANQVTDREKDKRRIGNGRTSPVSGVVTGSTRSSSTHEPGVRGDKSLHTSSLPPSSKRLPITSTPTIRTRPSRYAFSLVQSFPLTTNAFLQSTTNSFLFNVTNPTGNTGVFPDPPPFPLKLQQPLPSEGWIHVHQPNGGRSSPPQTQSRSLDTPRSSTQDLDPSSYQPTAFPPSHSGSRFTPSPGVARASSVSSTSANSSADVSTPPSSLVSRKTASLVFHPGAYGLAKKRHQPSPSSNLGGETFISPANEEGIQTLLKSIQVGEDAYFLRPDSLGIADGVGGWSTRKRRQPTPDEGEDVVHPTGYADPGMFARLLMGFCEDSLAGYWDRGDEEWLSDEGDSSSDDMNNKMSFSSSGGEASDKDEWANPIRERAMDSMNSQQQQQQQRQPSRRPLSPIEIMQRGFERTMSVVKAERIEGSSTALVAVLEDNQLRVANLGDCACMVIRNGEIVFRTIEMQHSFNFPQQLGGWARDEPMKDAELYTIEVEKNDIVLLSSDGVVDNLFDEDILEVIASFAPPSSTAHSPTSSPLPPCNPQSVAQALVDAAHSASESLEFPTPFMCKAIEEGIDFVGGKRDDVTCLVGVVQDGASDDI